MPKLFQSFVQIDSSLSRQYNGTGLGLALVKRLVEAQNGDVRVTSTPGHGSCFCITLPYAACSVASKSVGDKSNSELIATLPTPNYHPIFMEPEDRDPQISLAVAGLPSTPDPAPLEIVNSADLEPEKPAAVTPRQRPLILLAEDNKTNIETFVLYLTHSGYEIMLAKDGIEAIALAQSLQPDLILMDIQMPGMNGLESISKIRQIPALVHIPIIALTALAMPGDREKCLSSGANNYLSKPVKLKQLRQAIDDSIGTQQLNGSSVARADR